MNLLTRDEIQILLKNINQNMKSYNDDIEKKMEQSDRIELDSMKVKRPNLRLHEAFSGQLTKNGHM